VDVMLQGYAKTGPKRVTVVCPGFATDCLETLEEISMQNRDLFLAQGGEAFDYVPCLNSSPAHVEVMADVVLQHVGGWPEFGAGRLDDDALAAQRERALARGAQR
jgi:ferrochelatase